MTEIKIESKNSKIESIFGRRIPLKELKSYHNPISLTDGILYKISLSYRLGPDIRNPSKTRSSSPSSSTLQVNLG